MRLKLLILVLALQTLWIFAAVLQQEHLLRSGQIVLLETRPIDPRDLLRGDFVRLNYKISDIPREKFFPPVSQEPAAGTKIFVALVPVGTNGFWEVSRASAEKLELANSEVLVKGRAMWSWRNLTNSVRVEYGIEKYFVAEGTGNPQGKLTVQTVLSRSGRASIKQVFVDGVPYADAMR